MSLLKIVVILCFGFCRARAEEPTIILGTIEESSIVRIGTPYIHKLFQRIHIKSVDKPVPAERALEMISMSETDVDPFRIEGLEKAHPNIIRLPGVIYRSAIIAASPNPKLKVSGWGSLKELKICAKIGIKAIEERLVGIKQLFYSAHLIDMANMAIRGRCEVIIMHRGEWPEINRENIGSLYELSPILEQRDFYIYINKKHSALVPKLTQELEKMRQEGQWKEMQTKIDRASSEAKLQIAKRAKIQNNETDSK